MPRNKPNILIICGDDVATSNLSCYSHGAWASAAYIDRLAREGLMFANAYGEQTFTAGRAAFITGQSVLRTGFSKVRARRTPT